MQYSGSDDQSQFPRLVAMKEPFDQGAFYDYDPSPDRHVTTVYLARAGVMLGDFPERLTVRTGPYSRPPGRMLARRLPR